MWKLEASSAQTNTSAYSWWISEGGGTTWDGSSFSDGSGKDLLNLADLLACWLGVFLNSFWKTINLYDPNEWAMSGFGYKDNTFRNNSLVVFRSFSEICWQWDTSTTSPDSYLRCLAQRSHNRSCLVKCSGNLLFHMFPVVLGNLTITLPAMKVIRLTFKHCSKPALDKRSSVLLQFPAAGWEQVSVQCTAGHQTSTAGETCWKGLRLTAHCGVEHGSLGREPLKGNLRKKEEKKKKIWRQPDSGSAYSGKSAGDKLNKPWVQENEDLRPGEGGAWYNT